MRQAWMPWIVRSSPLVVAAFSLACGSAASPAPAGAPAPGGAPAADVQAKPKVNRLVMAFRKPPDEAFSQRMVCCFGGYQFRPMMEPLILQDQKTGLATVPGTATEWKLDESTNAIKFQLRKGVQFHDNYGEMTSKDVVYTLDSLNQNDPVSTNTWVLSWWRPFLNKAIPNGDYEVTLQLSSPQAQVYYFISDIFSMLGIRSKAQFDKVGEPKAIGEFASVGTGPYRWSAQKAGEYMRFERVNYKHWRITPDFPELEFRYINEASTRVAGLLAGEIHITDVPSDLQPQAEKAGMKRIQNLAKSPRVMGTFVCCYFNENKTWPMFPDSVLMDKRVREALNHAINREELGKAFAPNRQPVYLSHYNEQRPAWDASYQTRFESMYGYNPDKAKALLAEAGYTAAKPLEIDMPGGLQLAYIANGPDITDAVAGYFRGVGVKVNLLQLDLPTLGAQTRAYKFKNLVNMQSIGSNQLDGLAIWNTAVNGGSSAGFYNPELAALRDELNRQMDPAKQEPVLKKIGEWGFTNYWDIPLWYVPLEVMANPKIVDNWPYPGSANGGWSHFDYITAAK